MIEQIFNYLEVFCDFLWGYFALGLIVFVGSVFTIRSKCMQIRTLPSVMTTFFGLCRPSSKEEAPLQGIHPLKAFFASIGGCIGTGNIITVCVAVQIGGPGSLFWLWVTAFFGMVLKYAEVYVGMTHRVRNDEGSFDGGPMYYLQKAFKWSWIPSLTAVLLCIYGVETHVFNTMTVAFAENFDLPYYFIASILLALCLYAVVGGVDRVGTICSAIIPLFVFLFLGMSLWIMVHHIDRIPGVFSLIFRTAFNPEAAGGGVFGGIAITMIQGARQGAYSGDLGIGFAAIVNSESSEECPVKQASLNIFGIILDSFVICTMSVILVLVTDVWDKPVSAVFMVQSALETHFSHVNIFMPLFIFILGYSTLISYFVVGTKCAKYLHPRYGRQIYWVCSAFVWILFSFVNVNQALVIMNIPGGFLLVLNTIGLYRLRKEIVYQ